MNFSILLFISVLCNIDNSVGKITTHKYDICVYKNAKVYLEYGNRGLLYTKGSAGLGNKSEEFSVHNCSITFITCPTCTLLFKFSYLNLNENCNHKNEPESCSCDHIDILQPPFNQLTTKKYCGIHEFLNTSHVSYRTLIKIASVVFHYSTPYSNPFMIEIVSKRNRQFFMGNTNIAVSNSLSSPFFPAFYLRDLALDYIITCRPESPDCVINLIFTDFLIDYMSIIEIYDWDGQSLYVATGLQFRPKIILSNGPALIIRFFANSGRGIGFKAQYKFISRDVGNTSIPNLACGGPVDNLGGTITMINAVREGMEEFDCIWIIQPSEDYIKHQSHVYLKLISYNFVAGNTELIIREGRTSDKPVLGAFRYSSSETLSENEYVSTVENGFYLSLKGLFGKNSHMFISYAAFTYNDCSLTEFLCHNYRCIPIKLKCDNFDHCGDNSDETDNCKEEYIEIPDRNWRDVAPNYFFPKTDKYSDLKTAAAVFIISSIGFLGLISIIIILLYRMNARATHQRDLQNHLRNISDLLEEGSRDDESIIDEPPDYEAPPDYDEIIKIGLPFPDRSKQKKKSSKSKSKRKPKINLTSAINDASGSNLCQDMNKSEQTQIHHPHSDEGSSTGCGLTVSHNKIRKLLKKRNPKKLILQDINISPKIKKLLPKSRSYNDVLESFLKYETMDAEGKVNLFVRNASQNQCVDVPIVPRESSSDSELLNLSDGNLPRKYQVSESE